MKTKWRIVTTFQKWILNPISKPLAGILPGLVLLETKGRRSGRPRRTPMGGRLDGNTVWIVSEHGRRANYIKNFKADPNVRVRVRGRWRTGTARLLPDDDPRKRLRYNPNDLMIRVVGTDLMTVRVDLDPVISRAAHA